MSRRPTDAESPGVHWVYRIYDADQLTPGGVNMTLPATFVAKTMPAKHGGRVMSARRPRVGIPLSHWLVIFPLAALPWLALIGVVLWLRPGR